MASEEHDWYWESNGLAFLENGDVVETCSWQRWDEATKSWEIKECVRGIGPTKEQPVLKTFLPFVWNFSSWELAIKVFEAGKIKNINNMERSASWPPLSEW